MIQPIEKLNVFVYGSLRMGYFNYDKYLKGHVKNVRSARVKGKLYHMPNKGYPALVDGNDYVYGEVMEIDNYKEVMVSMDEMEGYFGEENKDNEYNRIPLNVEILQSNSIEKCYVYKYNLIHDKEFIAHRQYVDSGDWSKRLLKSSC